MLSLTRGGTKIEDARLRNSPCRLQDRWAEGERERKKMVKKRRLRSSISRLKHGDSVAGSARIMRTLSGARARLHPLDSRLNAKATIQLSGTSGLISLTSVRAESRLNKLSVATL